MTAINPASLCQIEVQVSDLERATAFYENVFGWPPAPAELHNYVVLKVPKDCPFGVSLIASEKARNGTGALTLYFEVNDFEPYLSAVETWGGSLALSQTEVMGYGQICHIADPDGQRWGLFLPKKS